MLLKLLINLFWKSFNEIQLNIDDYNQMNYIIKNIFIKLDKYSCELPKDHSGSVCIATLINFENSRGIIISKDGQIFTSTKDYLIIYRV
ncbi:unnamed protein product [Rotaria sordida]|uniref:Uncharacterized protein n=1 Tax=Rotaria sordida TaxID=392033 RepID=A0A815T4A9_9BILA|nr:unnamed protein product [Rotaria sordida]